MKGLENIFRKEESVIGKSEYFFPCQFKLLS